MNLIGEHTDYNGLPVLPISIDKNIIAAVSPLSSKDKNIRIINVNPDYVETQFELSGNIESSPKGNWSNYVKAAAQALIRKVSSNIHGAEIYFEGTLPSSAGLSSLLCAGGNLCAGDSGRKQYPYGLYRACRDTGGG